MVRIAAERGDSRVTIEVRPIAAVSLAGVFADGKALLGGTEIFATRFHDAAGAPLTGEAGIDLELDPDGILRQQPSPPHEVHLRYVALGVVEFGALWPLRRQVVDPATIAALSLEFERPMLAVGTATQGVVRIHDAAGDPVAGTVGLLGIESLHPTRCSAGRREGLWAFILAEVTGLRAGRCTVQAALGAHRATADVEVY